METLAVTCVKPFRGFLQIYGHKKPDLLQQLDSAISSYQPSIKRIAQQNGSELFRNVEFDIIYLALAKDTDKYHRCIVREKRAGNKAVIELIDYGSDFLVDANVVSKLKPFIYFNSLEAIAEVLLHRSMVLITAGFIIGFNLCLHCCNEI